MSFYVCVCVSPFEFRTALGPLAKVADCIFEAYAFLSLDPFGPDDSENAQFLLNVFLHLFRNLILSSKALC